MALLHLSQLRRQRAVVLQQDGEWALGSAICGNRGEARHWWTRREGGTRARPGAVRMKTNAGARQPQQRRRRRAAHLAADAAGAAGGGGGRARDAVGAAQWTAPRRSCCRHGPLHTKTERKEKGSHLEVAPRAEPSRFLSWRARQRSTLPPPPPPPPPPPTPPHTHTPHHPTHPRSQVPFHLPPGLCLGSKIAAKRVRSPSGAPLSLTNTSAGRGRRRGHGRGGGRGQAEAGVDRAHPLCSVPRRHRSRAASRGGGAHGCALTL